MRFPGLLKGIEPMIEGAVDFLQEQLPSRTEVRNLGVLAGECFAVVLYFLEYSGALSDFGIETSRGPF